MKKLIHISIILLSILTSQKAYSTIQEPDYLTYKGRTYEIYTGALEDYFNIHGRPDSLINKLGKHITSCWSGYIGHWEIKNDSLFLNRVEGDNTDIDLKLIFKDRQVNGKVFADWFNDTISNPHGKIMYFEEDFHDHVYQYERELVFKNGVLSETITHDNSDYVHDTIYIQCEEMPQFPGGELLLNKYIKDHTKYPESVKSKGISGRVFVEFVISKDGTIRDVKVMKPLEPSLDKEAIRVVKSLPKWKPGKQNGVTTNVWMTTIVYFNK